MIFATWNVNSLSVRLDHVLSWLSRTQADVLCLQETKLIDEKFPHDAFRQLGYFSECFGEKTYNGVAIVSKLPLTNVVKGFAGATEHDSKRLIAAHVDTVSVVNIYIPNGQAVGSSKYDYKLNWLSELQEYLDKSLSRSNSVLLCGDFNIAPEDIDVYDASSYGEQIMCSPVERSALVGFSNWGLQDAFRLHVKDGGHYSWWDYRQGAFRRNLGFRIDHIWVTAPLADRCLRSWIDTEPRRLERPSDHAPVLAEFAV
jgi:exodeoxyribonuclease-3